MVSQYLEDVSDLTRPFDGHREPQTPEEMVAYLNRYRIGGDKRGVWRFAYEVCKAQEIPGDWQPELFLVCGDPEEKRISVTSGHGVGKSGAAAIIIVHHHAIEIIARSAITAPTEKQMFNVLYPEVLKWLARCPPWLSDQFVVTSDRVAYKPKEKDWYASFATARPETPEALAGVHLGEGSVLLCADEGSAVHEKVFESASGSMSGHNVRTILFGNPTRTAGLFFDSHHKLKRKGERHPGDWWTLTVNAETCGRVSKDFIEDMARRYGKDSNQYRVRVLGEFPTSDADTIIPYEHVLSAQTRDIVVNKSQASVWGLDVARFGDDRTCLVKRRGKVVEEVPLVWQGKDTMQVSALVHAEWESTPNDQKPHAICVDSIGIGAGVVDRLRTLGLPVRGINVAESSAFSEQYANLKAELWLKTAKEWFAAKDCKIPEDDLRPGGIALGAELALPRFRFLPSGKLQVESKAEIKKRGFPSTDIADAFILTMAETQSIYQHGSTGASQAPIHRNSKWVV